VLQNLEEKWYYSKTAPLHLLETSPAEKKSWWFFSRLFNRSSTTVTWPSYYLQKRWPWSRQRLAWAQKWADEQDPTLDVKLIRDITWETVDEWRNLLGNINTTYTIEWVWEDNGKVIENWIIWDDKTIQIEKGEKILLEDLDFKYPHQEFFTFAAIDQAWNTAKVPVQLTISVPELEIELIEYLWVWAEVTTKLSDLIDRGQVKFERNRMWYREPLDPDTFSVKPLDPRVVWWLYPFDDRIKFFDDSGNEVWSINTQTWELELSDSARADVSFWQDGRWTLQVVNGDQWWSSNSLFWVSLRADPWTEWEVDVSGVNFESVPMESNFVWWFTEGICIKPFAGECHMFVSKEWDIYIPPIWQHEYEAEYGFEWWKVVYKVQDAVWNDIVDVRFTPQPFN
jgi:hypothetical protein